MSELAVDVEGVRKSYGETVALEGVSLSVETGEVIALLGPNGAGKTTLVRAITGTTDVDRGSVSVFGRPPTELDEERLGVLPQEFGPPGRLTARELVDYYGDLYDDRRGTDEVLATVGMAGNADTHYEDLSGGQKRRTCLGIALVNDPDLLVLDEPTTGIDPAGRRTVRERVERLADGGATVLLTTHDIDEAERLADRAALLGEGRLLATGSPADLVGEHGGEDRLIVETGGGDPPGVDRIAEATGRPVRGTGDGLVFPDVAAAEIGTVVDALDGAGVEYTAVRWARPTLEDVYLELTDAWSPDRVGRGSIADVDPDDAGTAGDADESGETGGERQ